MDNELRQRIIEDFDKTFDHPGNWCRDGRDWDNDPETPCVLWSGEGNYLAVEIDGEGFELPLFDYYAEDYTEETYTFGVHNSLMKWADKWGCYWECHDPGTFMLYPK